MGSVTQASSAHLGAHFCFSPTDSMLSSAWTASAARHSLISCPEELEMTLQRETVSLPPGSREVCPGTISKSAAPHSRMQFDILIKVAPEERQMGRMEARDPRVKQQRKNPVVDLQIKGTSAPKLISCSINPGGERQRMHLCQNAPRS